jgi:hypothetical protein
VKIKAFALVFFLFSAHLSLSQILVGPVAGGQYSWIGFGDKENKDLYKVKPVPGYHAGAALSFLVRKRFFLHTSFLYSSKGKIIEGKSGEPLKNKVTYHYIDVPILYTVDFKAKLGNLKEFKYYLGLGPNVSYWLGGKGKITYIDAGDNLVPEKPYTISFNKGPGDVSEGEMTIADANRIQLGLCLTAGAVFEPVVHRKFMVNLRYELGHSFFSPTSNGIFRDTYYQDVLRSRNQGIRLSVAYLVDLRTGERKKGKSTIKRKRL